MMETILFSFILILIIIWIMLGILYFYMRYVSPYGIWKSHTNLTHPGKVF